MQRENESCRRAINRFVKKMGLTRRKKKQNNVQAYNALVTFVVLRFENVNI